MVLSLWDMTGKYENKRRLVMPFEVYCRFCGEWVDTEDIDVSDVSANAEEQDTVKFSHLDCNPTEQESVVRSN